MHILLVKQKYKVGSIARYPIKWIIKLFTWSHYHHIAHTIIKDNKRFVSEAKKPFYRHIKLTHWILENKSSEIHAYKVIKKVDEDILAKHERKMTGKKYDVKGAVFSAIDNTPILNRLLKKSKDDQEQFCSESIIELFQSMGWIDRVKNENTFNPKEALQVAIDNKIINPEYEIWTSQ